MTSVSKETTPAADEYAPYYERYIGLVPAGDIIYTLRVQMTDTFKMLSGLTDEQAAVKMRVCG